MPPEIRAALLLWLTAQVVLEAGLGLVAGRDGIRLVVLAVVTVLVMRMAAGHNWARHALLLVFAPVSSWLVFGTVRWLAGDAVPVHLIGAEPGGLTSFLVASSVFAHAAAVAAALVYMYRPAANTYFRRAVAHRAPAEVH
jgi:hypothetical protein